MSEPKPPLKVCDWCNGKKWSQSALGLIACQKCDAKGKSGIDVHKLLAEWRALKKEVADLKRERDDYRMRNNVDEAIAFGKGM